jgi:hypothetical protein
MGYALLGSSGQTRLAALRAVADDLISLILGAAGLLLGAALIEAWWSPSSLPNQVKWGFSVGMSLLTVGFLLLYGRRGVASPS